MTVEHFLCRLLDAAEVVRSRFPGEPVSVLVEPADGRPQVVVRVRTSLPWEEAESRLDRVRCWSVHLRDPAWDNVLFLAELVLPADADPHGSSGG